jgi:Na+-driven multidrug efflux pump
MKARMGNSPEPPKTPSEPKRSRLRSAIIGSAFAICSLFASFVAFVVTCGTTFTSQYQRNNEHFEAAEAAALVAGTLAAIAVLALCGVWAYLIFFRRVDS